MANFSVLFSFDTYNTIGNGSGAFPNAGLIEDAQGNLYGATLLGGTSNGGAVYGVVNGANGYTEQTLFSFAANPSGRGNATGSQPQAGLVQDAGGNLYGTTSTGGTSNSGAVYELIKGANGYTDQTLFSFAAQDQNTGTNATGSYPYGGLTLDAQGNLYGSAEFGGANGGGAVYELINGPSGYTQQTLFSFADQSSATGANATGSSPNSTLTIDAQGDLFGTTVGGGTSSNGAVYELVKGTNGYTEQTLFSFADRDQNTGTNQSGSVPIGGVIADAQGNLYGTASLGGAGGTGLVYELVKGAGGYTQQTLFSFASDPNHGGNATGARPYGNLIADLQGNLYGTTTIGGAGDTGTVFELAKGANGYTEQVLFTFAAGSNANATGAQPIAGLIADSAGNLFGTAGAGGSHGSGVVFELTDTGFAVACYCAGTRIRVVLNDTETDVAVGALRIGDFVVTAAGTHRPIRWLGKRSYSGRFASRNPDVLPVCFKAGALAEGLPARDLWVSPKHAMFLDGVLVPAECLVNGISVVKAVSMDRMSRVDYYHVELDSHDVLLAEGTPSESFVDDGGRQIFHNALEHAALYPDSVRVDAVYYAPRIEEGYALEAIRRRIDARTAERAEVQCRTASSAA